MSNAGAGITEEQELTDDYLDQFVTEARPPVANFYEDSPAFMSCDYVSYSSGWICI